MGLFGDNRPKVTETEFKKVRQTLYERGLSHQKLDRLEAILADSLGGGSNTLKGLDKGEIDRTVTELRSHSDAKLFLPHELDKIEEELRKKL